VSLQSFALGFLLETLWERNGRICGICLAPMDLAGGHIDHIIPRSMGGGDTLENLQSSHAICNIKKGGSNRIPRPAPTPRPVFFYWKDVPDEYRAARMGSPPMNVCRAATRSGTSLYWECRGSRKMNSDLCVAHFHRRPRPTTSPEAAE